MTKVLKMLPVDAPVDGGFKALYTNSAGEQYEHPGIDQPAPIGTPVRLPAGGSFDIYPAGVYGDGSFGCCCIVNIPGDKYWAIMAHLEDQPRRAGSGDAGMQIGTVGMTGFTSGPHCHTGLSYETNATFAHYRAKDSQGVWRISPNSPLRDPLAHLEEAVELGYVTRAEYNELLRQVQRMDRGILLGEDGVGYDVIKPLRELNADVIEHAKATGHADIVAKENAS